MATTEHTINDAIAETLAKTRHEWRSGNVVSSENTGMLRGSARRPDILVAEPNVSPVVVETEVLPATTVESEALARLGEQLRVNGRIILSSVAVRLPSRLTKMSRAMLKTDIEKTTDLEIAVYTGSSPESATRWPRSGWLTGGIPDLSLIIQSASVPPDVIENAADQLVSGVSAAAGLLGEMAHQHPAVVDNICSQLKQENHEQTWRMAATILANAFVFQESLAGGPGDLASVVSIEELRDSMGKFSKSKVLAEWRKILAVNYWPIFDIARRILEVIPASHSGLLVECLASTAQKLLENRLMRSHDLTGAVFQRVIADRKFLAAYYTTPASAALLVGLAIKSEKTPANGSWQNATDIVTLRIADFACGTGTLLSTAYQRIGQLHEMAGGDAESLHPDMMASALVGCDVLPAAAHLTASMLAGAHPTVKYMKSSVLTVAYGKQPNGSITLGSLDLLTEQGELDIIAVSAKAIEGMGEKETETWASLPHAAFDVVVMNPPFTRATGQEGEKIGVHNPMFAAFSASKEDQKLMGDKIKSLTKGTSAHGNAGEASIFLVLAHRKLKTNGTLALVMPLSLMSGDAWEESRALLAKNYTAHTFVSIAGKEDHEMSFSADTGMGECLVVARKSKTRSGRATFVILKERPAYPMIGASIGAQIRQIEKVHKLRRIEDGPVGGTPLHFGDDVVGNAIDAPLSESGVWNLSRILDLSLAQVAYQLSSEKRLWLPTMKESEARRIPIKTIASIGATIGPYHADINFLNSDGSIRGPFEIAPLIPDQIPTYPVLWSHDAEKEKCMSFGADSEAFPRASSDPEVQKIIDQKVAFIWSTASHCHFNENFRFNSQATGMQFTAGQTIGGRAWTSIKLGSTKREKVLVLWANSTLGLLLHWWHANKQQAGRGNVGVNALADLPTLDVQSLSSDQIASAVKIFDDLSERELLPVHQIDQDGVRHLIDERFSREVLVLRS